MTQYAKEELSLIIQQLLSLSLIAILAYVFSLNDYQLPWWGLMGVGIGLSIIVFCWTGTKFIYFMAFLLFYTFVYSIFYNWSTIVH